MLTRRQFLTSAAALAATTRVRSWAQNVAESSRNLKITSIEAIAVKVPKEVEAGDLWMFVKLLTNKKGLVGYGEVYTLGVPFGPAVLSAMVKDFGEKLAVGADPYQIESLFQKAYAFGYSHSPELTKLGIISAIEMACWDIVGKDLNKPVFELLGGAVRNQIRSYSYIRSTKHDTPELWLDPQRAAQRAKEYQDQGFTAVKLDPVLRGSRMVYEYQMIYPIQENLEVLDRSQEVVGAVRKAVGSKCDILIGTHGQFTAAGAIRFAKRLEQFDPLWFEEPLPPENMDEMALVARGTTIPICTGERLTTKYDFARLIDHKAAAILNFDLGRVGGILEARKIAAMAEAHYLQVSPHHWGGPLSAAAAFQVDVGCPNFLIQESVEKLDGLYADILQSPIEWKDGYIIPSQRPGIGYELNETIAKKYAFQ